MKVRMLTAVAGNPRYDEGQVVDVERHIAHAWIEGKLAEFVREGELETAVVGSRGEQALTRRGRR